MGRLIAVVAVVAATACSSSTLPRTETYPVPPQVAWRAAHVAVEELGGRVLNSGPGGWFILGRLEDTAIGSPVSLDVTVREWMDGAEVRVKATTPDGPAGLGPDREEALRQLEEDYLDLVRRLTGGRLTAHSPGGR